MPQGGFAAGRRLAGAVGSWRSGGLLASAAAIALSTGISGLLGVVFWIAAARLYEPTVVGQASAVVSGVVAVSSLAQLELYGILTKFLPRAGERARALVLRCYAVAVVLGAVMAAGAVLVAPAVSDDLDVLRTPVFGTVFVVSVALWGLFALQDGVLVGVRRADVTVPENIAFAVLKLVLLVLVLDTSALYVLVSYTVPVLVCLLPVNILIFRRYLPQLPQGGERLTAAAVLRFARWDVVASWLTTATAGGIPLVVIALQGAEATGLFYAAWAMVMALELLSLALGTSLVVHSGYEPAQLQRSARVAMRTACAVVVPVVLIMVLGAELLLRLFGAPYAEAGQGLLRALAVAALLRALVVVASSADRAAGRPAWAVFNTAVMTLLGISGVVVGALSDGLTPIGVGWLVGSALGAMIVLPLWRERHRRWAAQAPVERAAERIRFA